MLNTIKKFPIIIISAPRTGSSALCEMLKEMYSFIPNISAFDEPLPPSERFEEFNKFYQKSNNFILKVQALEYKKIPLDLLNRIINKETTIVMLQRSDTLSQYVSHYIASTTKHWRFQKDQNNDMYNDYEIPINYDLILEAMKEIDFQNAVWTTLLNTLPVDYKLFMEDYSFEQKKLIPTIQPKNYEIIKDTIEKIHKRKYDFQQSKRT